MGRMEASVRLGGALQRLLVGIVIRTQPTLRLRNGIKPDEPLGGAASLNHGPYLLVHLVDVLEVVGARSLESLERLVEEELEVLECVLAEVVAPESCTRFTAQKDAGLVVVIHGPLYQDRLI